MLQLGLSANNRAELRGYIGVTADAPILVGGSAAAPMTAEVWVWDPASTATDDGITALLPTAMVAANPGRFVRLSVCGPSSKNFNNNPARTLTSGTGATGFRPSTVRDTQVSYSVQIDTTVSVSGNSTGYVVLEICPTNSATAGDWVEISRIASGQSGTLVVGLTLNQIGGGCLSGIIPAGYYAKQRTVNTAGTPAFTARGQQEVLI